MPVTRKRAGGANASARVRFSGPTTAMKERRRRDTHTQRERSRVATQRTSSHKAEEALEERERHRERRSRAIGSSVFVARDAASRAKTRMK